MNSFQDRDARGRSFAKAVSWRITGSIDTFIVSFFVTGKIGLAGTICGRRSGDKDRQLLRPRTCVGGRTLGAPQDLRARSGGRK
jgi:Predicted membrane protein (DUF2061)